MANNHKYLDYSGVQTLWTAIKNRDEAISASKAGYIHYDESAKVIQLWSSKADCDAYNAAPAKDAEGVPQPISSMNASSFVKDGMLQDVSIVKARDTESGFVTYLAPGAAEPTDYNDDTLFIQFVWNTDAGSKTDYIRLTDIAPVYEEGTGISIVDNKISFDSGKATQITTSSKIKLGGTWLGNQLKAQGVKDIDSNTDLQKLLKDLLSVESWPSKNGSYEAESLCKTTVSEASITNPGPTIVAYTSATGTTASTSAEVGTKLHLMISAGTATASATRSYSGFTYGYSKKPSTDSEFSIVAGNPASETKYGSILSGDYSVVIDEASDSFGTLPSITSSDKVADVKFANRIEFTVEDGTQTIKATQTTPNFRVTMPTTVDYYGVSTLEATDDKFKVAAQEEVIKDVTASTTGKQNTLSITGVRKMFWGSCDSSDISTLTDTVIRAAAGGSNKTAAKGQVDISAKGKKMFWVAYPATNTTWKITKALNDDSTFGEYSASFVKTSVDVPGANNHSAIAYTVWYYTLGAASTATTAHVTVG